MASFQSSLPSTSYPTGKNILSLYSLSPSQLTPLPFCGLSLPYPRWNTQQITSYNSAQTLQRFHFLRVSQCPCRMDKALCGVAALSSSWVPSPTVTVPWLPSQWCPQCSWGTPRTPHPRVSALAILSAGVFFSQTSTWLSTLNLDVLLCCRLLTEDFPGHLLTLWQVLPHALPIATP